MVSQRVNIYLPGSFVICVDWFLQLSVLSILTAWYTTSKPQSVPQTPLPDNEGMSQQAVWVSRRKRKDLRDASCAEGTHSSSFGETYKRALLTPKGAVDGRKPLKVHHMLNKEGLDLSERKSLVQVSASLSGLAAVFGLRIFSGWASGCTRRGHIQTSQSYVKLGLESNQNICTPNKPPGRTRHYI